MNGFRLAWWALPLLAVLVMAGCDEDKDIERHGGDPVGLVQISMDADTLLYWPGDTTCASGFVTVRDREGRAMPGVRVELGLANAAPGWIELTDPVMQDCTDVAGRVNFRYCVTGHTGENIVRAAVGNVVDQWPVWVLAGAHLFADSVDLWVEPDTLSALDSTAIFAHFFRDGERVFWPDTMAPPRIWATGGRVQPAPTISDPSGLVAWWYPSGDLGDFLFRIRVGEATDSAMVLVYPEVGQVALYLMPATVLVWAREGYQVQATAMVRDEAGMPLGGVPVTINTAPPCVDWWLEPPENGNFTDENGALLFWVGGYGWNGPCTSTVTVAAGGVEDAQTLVIRIRDWEVGSVQVLTDPADTLRTNFSPVDTARVVALVADSSHNPLSGMAVQFSAPGGNIACESAQTDVAGRQFCRWWPESYGRFVITAQSGVHIDTTWVVVLPLEVGSISLYLTPATVMVAAEDSFTVAGRAIVRDSGGLPLPGVSVDVELSPACATWRLSDPEGGNRTDEGGALGFIIEGYGTSAPCEMDVMVRAGGEEDRQILNIRLRG